MIRYFREIRLLPIAIVASTCLLVLTAADLLLGRNTSSQAEFVDATVVHTKSGLSPPVDAERSWAQQMFNFPGAKSDAPDRPRPALLPAVPPLVDKPNGDLITGSVTESEKSEKPKGETPAASKQPKEPPPSPDGRVIPNAGAPGPSSSERAILEHLQERRVELEKRARELDIREGLIAAAEKRVDSKLSEIKDGEAQLATATQKKDETEAARFKSLVTIYENMKPRDAAKIFDRTRGQCAYRNSFADQSTQHVGNSGANVRRPRRTVDGRAREPRPIVAEGWRWWSAQDRGPSRAVNLPEF